MAVIAPGPCRDGPSVPPERSDEEASLDLPRGRARDAFDDEEGPGCFEVRQPRAAPRAQLAFTDASLSKLIVMILLLAT